MTSLSETSILSGSSGVTSGYTINQSIRFNDGDNPVLYKSISSTSTSTTNTISMWVKRSKLGNSDSGSGSDAYGQTLFQSGRTASNYMELKFGGATAGGLGTAEDALSLYNVTGDSINMKINTNAVFRDVSAWYHIVAIFDTTNGVPGQRLRLYVNGVRQTNFSSSTFPSADTATEMFNNTSNTPSIGAVKNTSETVRHFDGYLAEIHVVNGYAYGPEYFGEFKEDTDIWIPKEYTGAYGTNGFKIDGRDSSDLGDDESGQGNDYSASGLAANDQVLDSPTNNFCTINPTYRGSSTTSGHYGAVSNGNLFIEHSGSNDGGQLCTQLLPSGKWYWEVYIKAGGNSSSYQLGSGIAAVNNGYYKQDGRNEGARAGEIGFNSYTGVVKFANSDTKTYSEAPFSDTHIIQIAADLDNGAIYYGKNGTFMGSGDPTSGASKTNAGATWSTSTYDGGWVPTTYVGGGSVPEIFINFGQEGTFGGNVSSGGNSDGKGIGDFKYNVPSGYLAICTKNLGS